MFKGGWVYILTNRNHRVLYSGVSSDLKGRTKKHIDHYYPGSFTARYNVTKLVYYKFYPTIVVAIAEEKRLKGGSRKQKIKLIDNMNPSWTDLWDSEVSKWQDL